MSRYTIKPASQHRAGFYVECAHTDTGEPLPEPLCPHFDTEELAQAWIYARADRALESIRDTLALFEAGTLGLSLADDALACVEESVTRWRKACARYADMLEESEGGRS